MASDRELGGEQDFEVDPVYKKKLGRPRKDHGLGIAKFTPTNEVIELLAALRLTDKQIAQVLDVSYETLAEDKEARAAIERGHQNLMTQVAKKAFELALKGDSKMIMFLLRTQWRWSEHIMIGTDSTNGGLAEDTRKKLDSIDRKNLIEFARYRENEYRG